jgi:hypothetical protein
MVGIFGYHKVVPTHRLIPGNPTFLGIAAAIVGKD